MSLRSAVLGFVFSNLVLALTGCAQEPLVPVGATFTAGVVSTTPPAAPELVARSTREEDQIWGLVADSQAVYLATTAGLLRFPLNGGPVTALTGPGRTLGPVYAIATDGQDLYVQGDAGASDLVIARVSKDGTQQTLLTPLGRWTQEAGARLVVADDSVYWTEPWVAESSFAGFAETRVYRVLKAGGEIQTVVEGMEDLDGLGLVQGSLLWTGRPRGFVSGSGCGNQVGAPHALSQRSVQGGPVVERARGTRPWSGPFFVTTADSRVFFLDQRVDDFAPRSTVLAELLPSGDVITRVELGVDVEDRQVVAMQGDASHLYWVVEHSSFDPNADVRTIIRAELIRANLDGSAVTTMATLPLGKTGVLRHSMFVGQDAVYLGIGDAAYRLPK